MKKGLLVLLAILLCVALVPRPAAAAVNFNFGIKAGASLSNNAWTDDDGTEKTLVRPTFGVFAVINLNETFAIQPEVNYLVTGEWWTITDGKNVQEFTYIHIPVLLKARLMKEGKFIPVVFAGPALGFLMSAKDGGIDRKEFFKSTDFGADLGLGAEMKAGKMKLVFDARYYLGLTNVFSAPIVTLELAPSSFGMKNRAIILTAGLVF